MKKSLLTWILLLLLAPLSYGQGNLWIGTNAGLCRYSLEQGAFAPLPFERSPLTEGLFTAPIQALKAGRDGSLWVGTENGLYRIAANMSSWQEFRADPQRPGGLHNNFITEITEDAQGNIWIGSDGGGLARWIAGTDRFIHYKNRLSDARSLVENNIEALYVDKNGGLWVGAHKGVSYYNPFQKPFRACHPEGTPGSLPPGMVQSIFVRPDGKAWIGIDDGGLVLFDPASQKFQGFLTGSSRDGQLPDNDIVAVLEGQQGALWIGSWGGGLSRRRANGNLHHFLKDEQAPAPLRDAFIWSLFEGRGGDIWIGTVSSGLIRYDGQRDTFQCFLPDSQAAGGLPGAWVLAIGEEEAGNIWVATNEGLCRFIPESGTFVRYPLPCLPGKEKLTAIHDGGSGQLWLASEIGLVQFEPGSGSCRLWQESDGLADNWVRSIQEDARGQHHHQLPLLDKRRQ